MKNKPMNHEQRQRVLWAAERTETSTSREAAILGGIVRCAMDTGHFSEAYVRHYCPQALLWFIRDLQLFGGQRIDTREPSNSEIAMVLARFQAIYKPPPDDAVPAAA